MFLAMCGIEINLDYSNSVDSELQVLIFTNDFYDCFLAQCFKQLLHFYHQVCCLDDKQFTDTWALFIK